MIDKITRPMLGLDMASPYIEILASKLTSRYYNWLLSKPATSRGNRQARGGSRYLVVIPGHLFYWFKLRV